MRATKLISSRKAAEKTTTFPAMVTHRPTDERHRDSICQDQKKEDKRDGTDLPISIPDRQPFLLKGREMRETWK
jgi:hypothetical protein